MYALDLMVSQNQSYSLCHYEKTIYSEQKKEEKLFVNRNQFRMDLNLAGDSFHVLIKNLQQRMQ